MLSDLEEATQRLLDNKSSAKKSYKKAIKYSNMSGKLSFVIPTVYLVCVLVERVLTGVNVVSISETTLTYIVVYGTLSTAVMSFIAFVVSSYFAFMSRKYDRTVKNTDILLKILRSI